MPGDMAEKEQKAFDTGIVQGANNERIASHFFKIRATELFGDRTPSEGYYYLSGLLIGDELGRLRTSNSEEIIICAENPQRQLYQRAADVLRIDAQSLTRPRMEHSVIIGQWQILKKQADA